MYKHVLSAALLVMLGLSIPSHGQVTMPLHAKLKYKKAAVPAEKNREGIEFQPYSADRWYKGNTHCHSDIDGERMPGHGDGPPEVTLQWYADHGYDFVVLTDHNYWHEDLAAPDGLLHIKGQEITNMRFHVNALGGTGYIRPAFGKDKITAYQHAIDESLAQGAVPVLNHPVTPLAYVYFDDFKALDNLHHFEVYNMQPGSYKRWGEPIWDHLLTEGYVIYGMATDDAHMFAEPTPKVGDPPGGGFIMVDADELSEAAILDSIREGRFYSSTGVSIDSYRVTAERIEIEVDSDEPCTIQFIGTGGEVLQEEIGVKGRYPVQGDELYVRVKVTDKKGRMALMQPVFFR